jgi:hypothetical protein
MQAVTYLKRLSMETVETHWWALDCLAQLRGLARQQLLCLHGTSHCSNMLHFKDNDKVGSVQLSRLSANLVAEVRTC